MAPRLVTLPEVAGAIGVEYRTLHNWVSRGILRPSVQASRGAGIPNLFSVQDTIKAKVVAGLRRSGASLERLREAAEVLERHPHALTHGAVVLVNGSVSIIDTAEAGEAIKRESPALVYDTEQAVREIRVALRSPSCE
jgi:DNA-binding transcriptional MerR regulator